MTAQEGSTMARPVVALLDKMPDASRDVVARVFGRDFDVVFAADDTAQAKRAVAASATALLTMWGAVDADTIAAAPGAKVIQKLGVGVEKIDVDAARAHGVSVLKAAGINADAVAELTVLLILAVGRQLLSATAAVREGLLAKETLRARSAQLLGKTVGLYGLGNIGQAVAARLAGFGVTLLYTDLRRVDPKIEAALRLRYVEPDELLAESDVLSLHLPSTPRTVGTIDATALAKVKPGAILVNTARGSLVDEDALVEALREGRLFGAGLDVTAQEPLPTSSALLSLDNVVLTPHVGGAVANNFPRVIERAYRNVRAVLAGMRVDAADVVWLQQ